MFGAFSLQGRDGFSQVLCADLLVLRKEDNCECLQRVTIECKREDLVLRIMGLDVGDKRIGISLSDPLGLTAQGLTTISRTNLAQDIQAIQCLALEHGVTEIVYGLPKNMDGSIGMQAQRVLGFINQLQKKTMIPVKAWDERLTSKTADETLIEGGLSRSKRKGKIDQVAATIILQSYLNHTYMRSQGLVE